MPLDLFANTGTQPSLYKIKSEVINGSGTGEYLQETPVPIAVGLRKAMSLSHSHPIALA